MTQTLGAKSIPARWVWLFAGAGAAAGALSVTGLTYLSMLGHGHSFWRLLAWQLCCWSFWVAAAPFVIEKGAALTDPRPAAGRWMKLFLVALALTIVHIPLAAVFTVWFQPYVPVSAYSLPEALVRQFRALFAVDLLAFAILTASGYALAVYHRARKLELRQSRLEHELTRAHLEALRLEIQPHFLFNTLNSVAALIRKGSDREALDTLVGLSELLRTSLDRREEPLTTVDAEIAFVKRYVELYRTRFADRLDVIYDVGEESLPCHAPTLVLQPLVENALQHGVSKRRGRCRLEVGARRDGTTVRLWVSDDGAGLPADFSVTGHAGIGLSNTASRLVELFGDEASLDVRARKGGGTVSEVVFPASIAVARAPAVTG